MRLAGNGRIVSVHVAAVLLTVAGLVLAVLSAPPAMASPGPSPVPVLAGPSMPAPACPGDHCADAGGPGSGCPGDTFNWMQTSTPAVMPRQVQAVGPPARHEALRRGRAPQPAVPPPRQAA